MKTALAILMTVTLALTSMPALAGGILVENGGELTHSVLQADGATSITLVLPAGSPLQKSLSAGLVLPELEVAVVEKGKKPKTPKQPAQEYLIITLEEVLVSSYRSNADGTVTVVLITEGYDRVTVGG